jgi:hypothetical protein
MAGLLGSSSWVSGLGGIGIRLIEEVIFVFAVCGLGFVIDGDAAGKLVNMYRQQIKPQQEEGRYRKWNRVEASYRTLVGCYLGCLQREPNNYNVQDLVTGFWFERTKKKFDSSRALIFRYHFPGFMSGDLYARVAGEVMCSRSVDRQGSAGRPAELTTTSSYDSMVSFANINLLRFYSYDSQEISGAKQEFDVNLD